MAIATATFLRDIIIFIRNNLRTNITDPISRTSGVGFVMTAYPKRETQYPIITVKTTNLDTQKLGMQSETVWINLDLEIRTWSKNAKESDDLTQDVINQLRSIQYGTNGTDEEQIYGFQLTSCVPIVETEEGDNTIHSKVCTFRYSAILS